MVTAAGQLQWCLRRSRLMALLLGLVLLSVTIPASADTTIQGFRVFVSASGEATTVMVQWTAIAAESGTSFVVYRSVDSSQGDQVCEQDYIGPGPYLCSDDDASFGTTYYYHLMERKLSGTETLLNTLGPIQLQEPTPSPTPTGESTATPTASVTPASTSMPATKTPVAPANEPQRTVEPSSPLATSAVQPVSAIPTGTATAARTVAAISTRPPATAKHNVSPIATPTGRSSASIRRTPASDVLVGNLATPRIRPSGSVADGQAMGPARVMLIVAAVAGVGGIALGVAALLLWRHGIR